MIIRQFYEKLGVFLAGLSKVDGVAYQREMDTLTREISEILKEYPGFEENADVQGLLLTKLCYFKKEKESLVVGKIADDFASFISTHRRNIPELSANIALRLVHKLAASHKGVGKMEQRMIKKIENALMNEKRVHS